MLSFTTTKLWITPWWWHLYPFFEVAFQAKPPCLWFFCMACIWGELFPLQFLFADFLLASSMLNQANGSQQHTIGNVILTPLTYVLHELVFWYDKDFHTMGGVSSFLFQGAAKVSLLMIGQQAIMDAYLCLLHLTAGILVGMFLM